MAKTRYLQLTDTTMFEYNMLGGDGETRDLPQLTKLIYTKLKDDHTALLSPVSCECESYTDSRGNVGYKKKFEPTTLNTINHFSCPEDKQDSMWYHFTDPDYKYVDASIFSDLNHDQIKVKEFSKYLTNPEGNSYPLDDTYNGIYGVRWDSLRLYFVNGYDFTNIYGMLARIYVEQNTEPGKESKYVDLCDFFFNRDNAYMLLKYLASPIFLGNDIYDRYIEVNLPCLYDLINQKHEDSHHDIIDTLDIKENTTIRLMFSIVLDNDVTLEPIEYEINTITNGDTVNEYVNLSYARSSTVKGTVPTDNINSDNLGCYISEVPGKPYIQFYATWRDKPLTKDIVWRFNKGIRLYDTSLVRRESPYEVDDYYEVEHSERKWLCMHEIKLSFCMGSTIIKEETYSMNQIFISDSDPDIFYYRPLIFDEMTGLYIDNIQIVYTMRFVNTNDKVQFVKVASLALTGNMGKYYAMGTSLTKSDMSPYKVFNKIVENKNGNPEGFGGIQNTKYVKVFYNSTNVVLDDNGGNLYRSYKYTLEMSQAPKSYKFIFKTQKSDGKYDYMDLTDGYYKLMFKDDAGATVLIEPTYTNNMNMYLGELEFNISSGNIVKLQNVEEGKRKMSIVSYNEDGSVSSMFDFRYNI